jgi:DNA-binding NarL/FixJ family response regulator
VRVYTAVPSARVVILTTLEGDAEIKRALRAGAARYFLKSTSLEDLVEAIRRMHAGKTSVPPEVAAQLAEQMGQEALTPRELAVVQQIAVGTRNREIGERLSITEEMVKVHVKHILEKLGASDRTHAVAIGLRRGIIQLSRGALRAQLRPGPGHP